jgi:hypothetical protein
MRNDTDLDFWDDPWDDPWAPPAMGQESVTMRHFDRQTAAKPPTAADDSLGLIIGLFALQFLVSIVAILASVLSGMAVASCGSGNCNFPLVTFSGFFALIGTAIVFAGTILFAGRRRNSNRRSWWVPLVGTVIEIGLFFLSSALLAAGLGFTLTQLFGSN